MFTSGRTNHHCQYFEGFKSPATENLKEMAAVESKGPLGSDENTISDASLAKQKELDELKTRAMEKDQELRALESTLAQGSEERKAEIEILKKGLGQAWMNTDSE